MRIELPLIGCKALMHVFRSWVALRLGVSKDQLLFRLQLDPLIHPYVRIEQI